MVFEEIDVLKRRFTDKYVVVDDSRPELRRFRGQTGVVKTVNMSGRALVMFDAFANIGWYDIDVGCLRIVDQPLPKAPEKHESAKQPAAKSVAKPAAAAAKPAAASTADILAAARGGKPAPAPAKPADVAPSVADVLAAARGKAAPPAKTVVDATPSSKPVSTADVLAAARAGKAAPDAPVAEPEAPAKKEAKPPAAASSAPTGTADIIALLRKMDGK